MYSEKQTKQGSGMCEEEEEEAMMSEIHEQAE